MKERTKLIFLCGMPGSGKSYVGKQLATHLQCEFVDLDDIIESKMKKQITEIFAEQGEDFFRLEEHRALQKVIQTNWKKDITVIALGGGTPCFHDNMELVNQKGTSIFLDPPIEVLANRMLGNDEVSKRPLIASGSYEEVKEQLLRKYKERLTYYSKADYKIKGDETMDLISSMIFTDLEN